MPSQDRLFLGAKTKEVIAKSTENMERKATTLTSRHRLTLLSFTIVLFIVYHLKLCINQSYRVITNSVGSKNNDRKNGCEI